jgi:hypothetical protein
MKVVTKSIMIAGVAALGLSLAACKKETTAEPQADEASEVASDSATDAMVAPVGASSEAKAAPAAKKN